MQARPQEIKGSTGMTSQGRDPETGSKCRQHGDITAKKMVAT